MKQGLLVVIAVTVVVEIVGSVSARASSGAWTSPTNGDWTNSVNWAGGTIAGANGTTNDTSTATFNTTPGVTVNIDAGRNVQSIVFDGADGAFTLSGGPLVLTNNGLIELGTTATSFTGTATTETIDSPLLLEGSYSFTNNSTTASNVLDFDAATTISLGVTGNSTLTLNGANTGANIISGRIVNGVGGLSINKSGAGNWILNGSTNISGTTTINAGTLELGSATALANAGQGGAVSINSANGLTFATGVGTFDLAGLNGNSNEVLADVSGNAITLQLGISSKPDGFYGYSYGGVLSDAPGLKSSVSMVGNPGQTFTNSNTYSGGTTLTMQSRGGASSGFGYLAGTSSTTGATPFGTGSITLNSGALYLAPSGSATDIAYTGVTAPGATFNYGSGYLALNKGGENSLTYTVGNGSGQVLNRIGNGVLVIAPFSGVANLGTAAGEKFIIDGTAPVVTNGMVAPTILGVSNASVGGKGFFVGNTGDFLTYDATNGFESAAPNYTVYSAGGTITPVTNTQIADVTLAGTFAAGSTVYALVANAGVSLAGVLNVGDNTAGHQAGIIINNTGISGGTIEFGASEGVIAAFNVGNIGGSVIDGTGGLTITGDAGQVFLNGSNTFRGGLTLAGGLQVYLGSNGEFGDVNNVITLNGSAGFNTFGATAQVAGRSVVLGAGGGIYSVGNQLVNYGYNTSGSGALTSSEGGGTVILSGNNTYTGGTYLTGSLSVISSDSNIGGAGSAITISPNYGSNTILGIMGDEVTGFGSHQVTFTSNNSVSTGNAGQTAVGFSILDPDNTFTLDRAVDVGNAGFNKYGVGTLLVDSTLNFGANGIAAIMVGGTLKVDESAGGSFVQANNLNFAGGNLYILGKTSGATTQNLGNVTLSGSAGSGGSLIVDANSGSGNTTVNLGSLSSGLNPGTALNVVGTGSGTGVATITTTSAPDATTGSLAGPGIYGGRIVYTDVNGQTNWATSSSVGPVYTLSGYTNYSAFDTSILFTSPVTDNALLTGSDSNMISGGGPYPLNSLKIANTAAGTLSMAGESLVLASGGLLFTGNAAYSVGDIGGGFLVAGSGSASALGNTDLIIQDYGTGTLTINAVIADATVGNGGITSGTSASTLTKAGPGMTVLTAANTYTGKTYIEGGVLSISANNQLGDPATGATLNINGGTLQVTATMGLYNGTPGTNNRGVNVGGDGATFDITNGSTLTINGNINSFDTGNANGSGSITLMSSDNSNSTLVLTGNDNGIASGFTINGGTLESSGNQVFNGGDANSLTFGNNTATIETLELNGNSAGFAELTAESANAIIENGSGGNQATFTLLQGGNTTFAGTLINGSTAVLNFLKSGGGQLDLTNANSSYTGFTELDNGTLNVASLTNGSVNSSIGASTNAASSLIFGGGSAGTAVLQYTGGSQQTTNRLFTLGDVNGNNGTIDASGSSGAATVQFTNTGAIAFNNNTDTHNLTLTGTNAGSGTNLNTFAPLLADTSSGAATSLTKSGTGAWALTNNNTYSGGTTVTNGQLFVDNTPSLPGDSGTGKGGVTITGGGTLSGVGQIAPVGGVGVMVGVGGTIAPGGIQPAPAPGAVANGNLTLNVTGTNNTVPILGATSAKFTFALGDALSSSKIVIGGTGANTVAFDLSNPSVVTINDLVGAGLVLYQDYILIDGNGSTNFTGLTFGTVNGNLEQITGGLELLAAGTPGNFFADYYGGSQLFYDTANNDILVEVAPEPGTWALLLAGFGFLLFYRQRRRTMRNAQ